jgi:hypothetical protein
VSFDSSVTVMRSNQVVCFAWIWIGICFGESAHRHGINTIFITYHHHQSSSNNLITSSTRSENKLFCFLARVSSIFDGFCNGSVLDVPFLFSHQFHNENLCLKAGTG